MIAGVKTTYALVADSYVGQFIIAKGNPYEMEKVYKKWYQKLFKRSIFGRRKLIKLPTPNNLPAVFTQDTFLGLSIVEIPQQHKEAAQTLDDSRMSDFLNRSQNLSDEAAKEKPGIDMLDQGMTR